MNSQLWIHRQLINRVDAEFKPKAQSWYNDVLEACESGVFSGYAIQVAAEYLETVDEVINNWREGADPKALNDRLRLQAELQKIVNQ